jgi:hypothetical protein
MVSRVNGPLVAGCHSCSNAGPFVLFGGENVRQTCLLHVRVLRISQLSLRDWIDRIHTLRRCVFIQDVQLNSAVSLSNEAAVNLAISTQN